MEILFGVLDMGAFSDILKTCDIGFCLKEYRAYTERIVVLEAGKSSKGEVGYKGIDEN